MAEACYVDLYRQPNFKGFDFDAIDESSEHGRRGAEGEFIFGERSAYADLGKRIVKFHMKAWFKKNSHLQDVRDFIAVLTSPGPGLLIHPTLEPMNAACVHAKVANSIRDGKGESFVDLEFVEANSWDNTDYIGAALVSLAIEPFLADAGAFFESVYQVDNLSYLDTPYVVGIVADAVGQLSSLLDSVVGINADRRMGAVRRDLDAVSGDRFKLRGAPFARATIETAFAAIDKYGTSPQLKIETFRKLANWAGTRPSARGEKATVVDAIYASIRMMSAAYLARASMESATITMGEAFQQYDMVSSVLEDERKIARSLCENSLYQALDAFTIHVQTVLLKRVYSAPTVVQYDFGYGVPAIVAAHEIFGDGRKFPLITRHNPKSPSYLVGPVVVAPRVDA
jgi:prophage DNA circulation protein